MDSVEAIHILTVRMCYIESKMSTPFRFSVKKSYLQTLEPLVFVFAIFLLSIMVIDAVLVNRVSARVQGATRLWKSTSILPFYSSSRYQNLDDACSSGFDAPAWVNFVVPSTAEASCGCQQNLCGYSKSHVFHVILNALNLVQRCAWKCNTPRYKCDGGPETTIMGFRSLYSRFSDYDGCANICNTRNEEYGDRAECSSTSTMDASRHNRHQRGHDFRAQM